MPKKVAVIIVTYNASEYIGELFSSLKKVNYLKENFEIVVIDNASQDETIKKISNFQSQISNLKIFKNEKNLGFTGGNNQGIRYALEKDYDYVYLLNHDTIVDPDFLTQAITVAESDQRIGSVQSLLLLWPEKDLINSWGNEIHYLGFAYSGGYKSPISDRQSPIAQKEITYASGAACLLRLSVLKEIGLLNDAFFMYHEDVDMGWRMWLSGYRVVLAPLSKVFHKYEFSRSIKKYYYMERNRYMVLFQNYSSGTLLALLPILCLLDFAMLVYSVIRGFWREELRAFAYFFKWRNWKQMIVTRKKVQLTRKISDREILKHFTGVIAFQDVQSSMVKYIMNPVFKAYFFLVKKIVFW